MPSSLSRILGVDHDTAGQCSNAKLGYTFDSNVAQDLHVDGITDAISETLSAALALHVIGTPPLDTWCQRLTALSPAIQTVSSHSLRSWAPYSSGNGA